LPHFAFSLRMNFAKFIRSENAKWGKLITDAGIKGE